jgi:hypothetical protein
MRSKVLKQDNLMLRSERLETWATSGSLISDNQYYRTGPARFELIQSKSRRPTVK